MKRRADAYLSHTVRSVPIDWMFRGHELRHDVRRLVDLGVVRVIAGAVLCHVTIQLQRPYFRPEQIDELLMKDVTPRESVA